jgi:hypothetical protein
MVNDHPQPDGKSSTRPIEPPRAEREAKPQTASLRELLEQEARRLPQMDVAATNISSAIVCGPI